MKEFIAHGRSAHLGASAGPPLVTSDEELKKFREEYTIPEFIPATLNRGETVRGVIGLDGGSTSSKAVLIDEDGEILCKQYQLSQGNPIADTKELLAKIKGFVHDQGATLEIIGFGGTGYAADVLEESVRADVNVVETVAHMMAAVRFCGDVDVICDIGGQDIDVIVGVVTKVLRITSDSVEPPLSVITTTDSVCLLGIVKLEGRLVILPDLEKVLTESEMAALSNVGNDAEVAGAAD